MAKSKAVENKLIEAKELATKVNNEELNKAIEALEALEDATHTNKEYKTLKDLVDTLESTVDDAGAETNTETETETETKGGGDDTGDAGVGADTGAGAEVETSNDDAEVDNTEVKEEPKKRLDYTGIKMIGAKWYCKKDGYKKGFGTANECAEHFNK